MSFPSKAEREKCWSSRDEFWKCLDENQNKSDVCAKFRALYESSCPAQWVKHFDRKREYLKFKDRIQNEGSEVNMISTGLMEANETLQENSSIDATLSSATSSNSTGCKSPNTRVFRKFPQTPSPSIT